MSKKFFDIIPPQQAKSFSKEPKEPEYKTKISVPKERITRDFGLFSKSPIKEEKKIEKREKEAKPKPKKVFLRGLIFILLFLAALGAGSYITFSKTEIELWPKTEILDLKETVTVDSGINQPDFSKKIIPAKVFKDQKSGSQDFSATGKVLKEEKSRGVIRVYNAYSDSPQGLWASTRFVSSDGKLFKSLKKEVIPAKTYDKGKVVPGYADIEVQAAETGEDYNIGPSTFSLPGFVGTSQYTAIYAKSFLPMTGGFKGEMPQVIQKDLDTAKNNLSDKIKKESKEFLKSTISADFILLDELISQEIAQEKSSVKAGAEADFFNFQIETKSEVLVFKKSDIENFVKNLINSRIPQDKKVQEESLKISYSLNNKEANKAVIILDINAKIYASIDLVEFKKAITEKSFQEIKMILGDHPQIKKIEIKSAPFWRKKVPENLKKIEIKINLND